MHTLHEMIEKEAAWHHASLLQGVHATQAAEGKASTAAKKLVHKVQGSEVSDSLSLLS